MKTKNKREVCKVNVVDIEPQSPASVLLYQIKQGAKEAVEIRSGKRKGKPLSNLLTEL